MPARANFVAYLLYGRYACGYALSLCSLKLSNDSAKGLEGKLSELEALLTEGNTDKSNAKNYAKNTVNKAEDHTAENVEKNIEQGTLSFVNNNLAKGLENKLSKLEVLLTEGDTYKGNAEHKADYVVQSSKKESAEYTPKEITKFLHVKSSLCFLIKIILSQKKENVNKKINFF